MKLYLQTFLPLLLLFFLMACSSTIPTDKKEEFNHLQQEKDSLCLILEQQKDSIQQLHQYIDKRTQKTVKEWEEEAYQPYAMQEGDGIILPNEFYLEGKMDTYTFKLFLRSYDMEEEAVLLQKDSIELTGHYQYRTDYDSIPLTGYWNPISGDITLSHEKDGSIQETFKGKVVQHFQQINGQWTDKRNGRRLDFKIVKLNTSKEQHQFIQLYKQLERTYNPEWSVGIGIKNKGIYLANLEGGWNAGVDEFSNLTLSIYHTYGSTATSSIESISLRTWRTKNRQTYFFESEWAYSYTEKLLEGFEANDLSQASSNQRGFWVYQPSDSTFVNIWENDSEVYKVYWEETLETMILQQGDKRWRFGNYPLLLPIVVPPKE